MKTNASVKNMSKLSETQKKRIKSDIFPPYSLRIGALFGRKPKTLWTIYEVEALQQIGELDEDDVLALEDYYLNFKVVNGFDPRRRDLATLLNNWTTEIDRARQWKKTKVSSTAPTVWESAKLLEELRNQAIIFRNRHSTMGSHGYEEILPEHKDEYYRLKEKIKELETTVRGI
jgi:hypothetical protein